jgi:hypothetical protein
MSNSINNSIDSTDSTGGQATAKRREPAIVLLILAVFAGGVALCAALMVPILWTAMSETLQRPGPTYQQCGAVKEDAARLTCFDRILLQNSLRYLTKDASRITLGEILMWKLNRPSSNDSGAQQ